MQGRLPKRQSRKGAAHASHWGCSWCGLLKRHNCTSTSDTPNPHTLSMMLAPEEYNTHCEARRVLCEKPVSSPSSTFPRRLHKASAGRNAKSVPKHMSLDSKRRQSNAVVTPSKGVTDARGHHGGSTEKHRLSASSAAISAVFPHPQPPTYHTRGHDHALEAVAPRQFIIYGHFLIFYLLLG